MTILPVSTSTASEKMRTILLVVAIAVALSAGENEEIVGAVVSIVIDNEEEADEVLPTESVAVAVKEWLPSGRVDDVIENTPLLSAVAEPKLVLKLSPIKLWLAHW